MAAYMTELMAMWMTEVQILSVPLTACLFHLDTSAVDIFHCANVYCHS